VTRYAPLWQQAATYPAGTDRGLLGALWPASGSTGGAVTTIANTMQVSVAPGTAAVALTTAGALTQLCRWDAAEVVTLAAAPPAGSSRIDLVVLQVRDNTLDAGGNNDFIFQAIAGAGGTPGPGAVPAVPTNAYAMGQLTVPGGAANLNGVTVVDRRLPLNPRDQVYGRVRRNAAYTSVAAAVTNIPFDTVEEDPGAGFTTGVNAAYTCPITGHYLCNGRLSVGGGTRVFTELRKNGAIYSRGMDVVGSGQPSGSTVSTVVNCAAGDTLQVFYYTAAALAVDVGVGLCWMDVRYIGS